ncbi:inositol monophosphatase family protein [Pseudogemmobacter faecipullorum]|uniref:Inositol monophosphatase family protein n=1 Tax=Pseudogemmobacter faecipullorum TaxID=2755041 RepID=A0ABS8CM77_9RHOB|nr:inositol monophosphatase family protein [Pseudogemmobacter faecipullorum]MCB5410484.1 inositol monophosphatase family protein [Pseudogemmobacter faecipullorum]
MPQSPRQSSAQPLCAADLSPALIDELTTTAHALADAARKASLRWFRHPGLAAESKESQRFDPVTLGDREAEIAMREILARLRPDDAVFGEEQGVTEGSSGLTWVLDPIDGTRGFLSGTPTWGVLIAVGDASGPLYGLIDQPYIGERFEGGFGRARLQGPQGEQPLACRGPRGLDQAILFSTFPEIGSPAEAAAFQRVAGAVKLVRYGMDCYAYALLAAGQIDLVIEAGLQAYDIQGPMAVIRAAGGIVTNWQGGDAAQGGQVIAAANPEIHAAALALLQAG